LALFLGYDIQINHSIYHQTIDVIQKAQVTSVLLKSRRLSKILSDGCEVSVCIQTFFIRASVFTTNRLCTLSFGPSENMTVVINVFLTETYNSGGYFVQKLKSDSLFSHYVYDLNMLICAFSVIQISFWL
jgi:hypothetical protein